MIKKYIPKPIKLGLHLLMAFFGAVRYGFPSKKLLVIGLTGTSGKSSSIVLLRRILEKAEFTVGSLSTIDFYIDGKKQMNDKKMTMLGRAQIQKYLHKMVKAKCDVAIVEVTSEGFVQHRHRFINFDYILLTNLYPEHIESHGGYENYKNAKLGIFKYVSNNKKKKWKGKIIPKTCVINGEVKEADEFLDAGCEHHIVYARNDKELHIEKRRIDVLKQLFLAKDIKITKKGLSFSIDGQKFVVPMYGEHNIMNMLGVSSIARQLEIPWNIIVSALKDGIVIPGRVEFIKEAKEQGFDIVVDYAFEPVAMQKLYDIVKMIDPRKIIHVFGSTGGGRDIERRFTVGEMVGKNADIVFVTDEDPYDDDPLKIMEDVALAVEKTGKIKNKDLFLVLDRSEAIEKAVLIAEKGDIVLITGKGSEQAMVMAQNTLVPWDDRVEARKALRKRL